MSIAPKQLLPLGNITLPANAPFFLDLNKPNSISNPLETTGHPLWWNIKNPNDLPSWIVFHPYRGTLEGMTPSLSELVGSAQKNVSQVNRLMFQVSNGALEVKGSDSDPSSSTSLVTLDIPLTMEINLQPQKLDLIFPLTQQGIPVFRWSLAEIGSKDVNEYSVCFVHETFVSPSGLPIELTVKHGAAGMLLPTWLKWDQDRFCFYAANVTRRQIGVDVDQGTLYSPPRSNDTSSGLYFLPVMVYATDGSTGRISPFALPIVIVTEKEYPFPEVKMDRAAINDEPLEVFVGESLVLPLSIENGTLVQLVQFVNGTQVQMLNESFSWLSWNGSMVTGIPSEDNAGTWRIQWIASNPHHYGTSVIDIVNETWKGAGSTIVTATIIVRKRPLLALNSVAVMSLPKGGISGVPFISMHVPPTSGNSTSFVKILIPSLWNTTEDLQLGVFDLLGRPCPHWLTVDYDQGTGNTVFSGYPIYGQISSIRLNLTAIPVKSSTPLKEILLLDLVINEQRIPEAIGSMFIEWQVGAPFRYPIPIDRIDTFDGKPASIQFPSEAKSDLYFDKGTLLLRGSSNMTGSSSLRMMVTDSSGAFNLIDLSVVATENPMPASDSHLPFSLVFIVLAAVLATLLLLGLIALVVGYFHYADSRRKKEYELKQLRFLQSPSRMGFFTTTLVEPNKSYVKDYLRYVFSCGCCRRRSAVKGTTFPPYRFNYPNSTTQQAPETRGQQPTSQYDGFTEIDLSEEPKPSGSSSQSSWSRRSSVPDSKITIKAGIGRALHFEFPVDTLLEQFQHLPSSSLSLPSLPSSSSSSVPAASRQHPYIGDVLPPLPAVGGTYFL